MIKFINAPELKEVFQIILSDGIILQNEAFQGGELEDLKKSFKKTIVNIVEV